MLKTLSFLISLCCAQEPKSEPVNQFDRLPDEILLHVFSFLEDSPQAIRTCLFVDQRFQGCLLSVLADDPEYTQNDTVVDISFKRRKPRAVIVRMALAEVAGGVAPVVYGCNPPKENICALAGQRGFAQLRLFKPRAQLTQEELDVVESASYPDIIELTADFNDPEMMFWFIKAAPTVRKLTLICSTYHSRNLFSVMLDLNRIFGLYFPALEELSLSGLSIGSVNFINFLRASNHFSALRILDLSYNEIGNSGAGFLANSTLLRQLHTLDLSHNQISSRSLAYLLRSPLMVNMTNLSLYHNGVSELGVVRGRGPGLNIRGDLYEGYRRIRNGFVWDPDADGARILDALRHSKYLCALTTLNLYGTNVFSGRDEEVFGYPSLPSLTRLQIAQVPTTRRPVAETSG